MSVRGAQKHVHPTQQNHAKLQDDYVTYVTRIEKTTSMTEGPHFPNLHAIYKHKEEYEEEKRCHGGRFGKAIHLERFEEKDTYRV